MTNVWSRDVSPGTDTSQYHVLQIEDGVNHTLSIDWCELASCRRWW